MSSIELTNGSATITPRADYLLVVEHGTLSTTAEVTRYTTQLEEAAVRYELRRLLVDARSDASDAAGQGDARAAMWRWIRSQRTFEMIGFVLIDSMMIARVNMTALSEKLSIRAFDSVAEGHRWLAKKRGSTASLQAVAGGREPGSSPPGATAPSGGSARDSSTRMRPKLGTTGTVEGDAFAPDPGSTGEHTRSTVKIAAIDEATADKKLGR